jgi:hypothetical protein
LEAGLESDRGMDVGICLPLWVVYPYLVSVNVALTSVAGYFPKLVLLLPNVLLVSILLATYPSSNDPPDHKKLSPPAPPGEGSVDWQANLQAIQNLMGA